MSIVNNIPNASSDQSRLQTRQWQPDFPLVYDGTYGPYRPITDKIQSIQKDFENLLQTSPGEWPFDPDLGIGLRHYLFEFHNSLKMRELEPTIRSQLERYLPSVDLIGATITATPQEKDESYAVIKIRYSIMTLTLAELAAELLSWQGRMRFTSTLNRGLFASGDIYNSNAISNEVTTI